MIEAKRDQLLIPVEETLEQMRKEAKDLSDLAWAIAGMLDKVEKQRDAIRRDIARIEASGIRYIPAF